MHVCEDESLLLSCWILVRVEGEFCWEETVWVAKVTDQILSALYFSEGIECYAGGARGEEQSRLLRYLETLLKNDFICCKT